MSKKKPMTAREFVVNNNCPVCWSEDISWGCCEVVENTTYQEARCQNCGAVFSTISRLVGYLPHGEDPVTIKEDFCEVTSIEEPVDVVRDELHAADGIIRKLVKIIRRCTTLKERQEMPSLRQKERAALLRKE